MIVDAILRAIFASIGALLTFMPEFELEAPAIIPSDLGRMFYHVSTIFPLGILLTIWGLMTAIKVALNVWDFLLFVYHQFWGAS